jgi:hypothetical protein
MKKILFIICLMGCISSEERVSNNLDVLKSELEYYKDTKANVCFSVVKMIGSPTGEVTSVPCTPEVENLAQTFKSGSK